MRCTIWIVVVLAMLSVGCREQAIQSAATEGAELRIATNDESKYHAPPKPVERPSSDKKPPKAAAAVVELNVLALTAPADWERKSAGSSFVAAEFSLPHVEGDDADGRLTISTAGGSVQANIDRWKSQFAPQPTETAQEEVDVAGLKVTIVDLSGEFNDQRGPFAPGVKRPNYRMIGAVIPVGEQLHFIKATGPEKTIASHADTIRQFIRSARPNQ